MSLLGRLVRSLRPGGGGARRGDAASGGAPVGVGAVRMLYRGDLAGCRYISENTLAALSGESVEALHRLELFDAEGQRLQVVEERSRRPFVCLMPEPGGPALASVRVSLQVDPERLGPEAAALLRQLASPGRACAQLRRGAGDPWESVRDRGREMEGEGAELAVPADHPLPVAVLNPAAEAVVVTVALRGGVGASGGAHASGGEVPPTLTVPAGGARSLLVPPRGGTLQLRAPHVPRTAPRPQVVLEPLSVGGPWRSHTL
ncbi:MAG: hypothetical protein ACK522_01560 [Synechococcaceae cyanobacterium]